MDMRDVKSTNIKSVGYDPKERTLAVAFSDGSLYHYHNIERNKFEDLAEAKSVGSFLHEHIKGVYKHTKMPSE